MEWGKYLIDFVLHLDTHLYGLVSTYGIWVHVLLFVIVFAETGFVATPFYREILYYLPPVQLPPPGL